MNCCSESAPKYYYYGFPFSQGAISTSSHLIDQAFMTPILLLAQYPAFGLSSRLLQVYGGYSGQIKTS